MTQPRRAAAAGGELLERLRKVLELEQRKGCADTAVMGGLDGFLRTMLERNGLPADSPSGRGAVAAPDRRTEQPADHRRDNDGISVRTSRAGIRP